MLAPLFGLALVATSAQATPVPGISDFNADLDQPLRINFSCPVKYITQKSLPTNFDKLSSRTQQLLREKALKGKESFECFAEFTREHINVNDQQLIPRSSVKRFWEIFS